MFVRFIPPLPPAALDAFFITHHGYHPYARACIVLNVQLRQVMWRQASFFSIRMPHLGHGLVVALIKACVVTVDRVDPASCI